MEVKPNTAAASLHMYSHVQMQIKLHACINMQCNNNKSLSSTHNITVPAQVTGVSLSKGARSGAPALGVSWDSPKSDAAITRYEVQYRRRSGSPWRSVPSITGSPPPTNTHLESLQAGTSYHVQVRAVSAIGDGGWSDAAMETTYNGEWSANMGQTLAAGVMYE